ARERADHGAVLRRRVVDVDRGAHAAGAFAVLRNDVGLARDVLAEMARDEPAVEIVAAADAVADHQRDVLAAVAILDAVGAGRIGHAEDKSEQRQGGASMRVSHCVPQDYIGGKICGNLARSRPRKSPLTSTTTGKVFFSFMS